MRPRALHPRPDQISLLTHGVSLPLPEIPREHLDIIVETIIEAYNSIKASNPAIIALNDEVETTTALRNKLMRMLPSHALFRTVVHYIARDEKSLSFDGTHIEKSPDLSFQLTIQGRSFPLLAEAKVIKFGGSQSAYSYCREGILRFVGGEYSWWDSDAIMVAYVAESQTVECDLLPLLRLNTKKKNSYATKDAPALTRLGVQSLPRSVHFRTFRYDPGTLGSGLPGTISLWHLWLS